MTDLLYIPVWLRRTEPTGPVRAPRQRKLKMPSAEFHAKLARRKARERKAAAQRRLTDV